MGGFRCYFLYILCFHPFAPPNEHPRYGARLGHKEMEGGAWREGERETQEEEGFSFNYASRYLKN